MASASDRSTESIVQAFLSIPRRAADDPDIQRRARFLTCDLEIGVGTVPIAIRIESGRVTEAKRGPFLLKSFDFAIRAEPEVWSKFFEAEPEPGFHDLMAMTKVGRARVEGDLVPFMGNLQAIKDLLALPRGCIPSGALA